MSIVDEFLKSILTFLQTKDGNQLRLFLRVEPPLPDQFTQLSQELKQRFPRVKQEAIDGRNAKLDDYIEKLVPVPDDDETSGAWPSFQIFIREYFKFWRDVEFDDLLTTHTLLSEATKYVPQPVANTVLTFGSQRLHHSSFTRDTRFTGPPGNFPAMLCPWKTCYELG